MLALGLLLLAAHGVGYLFRRLRQPPVIGEIVGGLLLGPTVLGAFAPAVQARLFPASGTTAPVLGAVYQLGLILLMFTAGAEIRSMFDRRARRTAAFVAVVGTAIPFACGLVAFQALHPGAIEGSAHNRTALLLVFGIALAVTSIPVISRIMLDLGVLESGFARIVLSVAVIEDVVLYVVLAIALGLVTRGHGDDFGLPAVLGLEPGSAPGAVYHVVATVGFLVLFRTLGPRFFQAAMRTRFNLVHRGSAIGFQLAFVLTATWACMLLGVTPLFGALVAGMVVATVGPDCAPAREAIKEFSLAFFVPVYFAIVGLRLDLLHDLRPLFFLGFLVFACVAKSVSVYAGSRLAGERPPAARHLSIAMNARGGPGIVLASVALDARIINAQFYASLVLLAIATSLLAGYSLQRAVRRSGALSTGSEAGLIDTDAEVPRLLDRGPLPRNLGPAAASSEVRA